jgi:hypothetical protein
MLDNDVVIKDMLFAIIKTVKRRVNENFAVSAIGAIIKTLETRYDYFHFVFIDIDPIDGIVIRVSQDINHINPTMLARAIETIVQIIYYDLQEKAGLYFIREIVRNASEQVIMSLNEAGVDLELLELQQQFLRKRENRKLKKKKGGQLDDTTESIDNESLLGYSMDNVSHWDFDLEDKVCIVYSNEGNILDRINLDNIVKKYIIENSQDQLENDAKKKIQLNEKEYNLLKILQSQDTDSSSVCSVLNISVKELDEIVKKLSKLELIHYISTNELVLSEIGQSYLKKKEKEIVEKTL